MYQQHQIPKTLKSASGLEQLQALLDSCSFKNRRQLSRAVCEEFEFYDARGQPQETSSLKALRDLEQSGRIELPPSTRTVRQVRARGLDEPVPLPEAVPARVDQVLGLELELVEDESRRRFWNELMKREHPCGAAVQAGCQLRYLVMSAHGCLGAIGFSSSLLSLRSRDEWMGWDTETKSLHLNRVTGMSRFLIRPSVRCKDLASKVLDEVLRRLPEDFKARYGYRPYLVETLTNGAQSGDSLRASNWLHVGETTGRGRYGENAAKAGIKSVYVYELESNWRQLLGIAPVRNKVEARELAAGLEINSWAQQEFAGAPLGDKRRSRRLVKSADIQARQPMASFTTAAGADSAAMHGHYRLIDLPAQSEMTPQNILAPHRQRTKERMQGQREVLCVQDGTDLNFANHGACKGLGLIARNKNSAGTLGIHMHSMLVINAQGVPLGVPHIEYGHMDEEDCSTQRWVRGLQATAQLAEQLEDVRVIAVMDREGDCFEVLSELPRLSGVELVVRAQYDRSQGKDKPSLFAGIRALPSKADFEVPVLAESARRSTRTQKARPKRPARMAKVELRWQAVQIQPTDGFAGASPVALNLVHVHEPEAPAAGEPLEWFLLTSLAVTTAEEAHQVVARYLLRWRIEDWHRVLKSGCRVEFLMHRTGERIERAVTINAVIAWRLTAMTLLGRETPELPIQVLFSDTEIGVLEDCARKYGWTVPADVGTGVLTMVRMVGYQNRKRDPPPGYKKIWEGYIRLVTMSDAYELALNRMQQDEGWHYRKLRPD